MLDWVHFSHSYYLTQIKAEPDKRKKKKKPKSDN